MLVCECECESCSVVSNSLRYSSWNSPSLNTGVGSLSFLQAIFPTQGWNLGLSHCRQILYQLSHKINPRILEWVAFPFSSGSSLPRNGTRVSCIAGRFFTNWAIRKSYWRLKGFPGAQRIKNPPAMRVRAVSWKDPLEEGMATHSSILAWRIPWIEKRGRLQSMGSQRVGHDRATQHSIAAPWGQPFQEIFAR